jgi:tRNA A-37 threonylcarbamoyl transferase component Bud32
VTDQGGSEHSSNPGTRIGSEIAGYRIESVIGRGGMSVIYLATQIRLGRRVALKLLASELAEDERFRERFVREAHLASEINHPNIIPIYDAGEDGGYLYLAMRYVDGPSLRELLRSGGPLSLGRLIYLIEQVASALDVAHAAGLVHRDVKPANILLEEASDHAFLTDFGVAKRTTARGLTQTGLIVGTFEYLAPEQIEALAVDARTDVYGLGCTIFECITGSLPFDRESEVAIMHAHLAAAPPNVTQRRPDLPLALNDVIAKALAKSPDDRYQSCGELAGALRAAALRSTSGRPTAVESSVVTQHELSEAAAPVPPAPTLDVPQPAPVVAAASAGGGGATGEDVSAAAGSGGHGSGIPAGRLRLVLIVGVLVLAAAALGAAGFALVGGDGNKHAGGATLGTSPTMTTAMSTAMSTATTTATSTAMSTGMTTQTGMTMTGPDTSKPPAARLTAFIAEHPTWHCDSMDMPLFGALATKTCSTQVPQRLTISVYGSKAKLRQAYEQARHSLGSPPAASGRCSATSWAGEGVWFHGENEPGGRKFCRLLTSPTISRLVWYADLSTPTLFQADYASFDHRTLFFWWENTRHEPF